MNTQDRYLDVIRSLQDINHRLQSNSTTQESLHYLQGQIAAFKVVVPVVGKFSSGKSTQLNLVSWTHQLPQVKEEEFIDQYKLESIH